MAKYARRRTQRRLRRRSVKRGSKRRATGGAIFIGGKRTIGRSMHRGIAGGSVVFGL